MTALPLDAELIQILISADDKDLKRAERLISDAYDELDPGDSANVIRLIRLTRDLKHHARQNAHQAMRMIAFLMEGRSPADTPPETGSKS